MTNTLQKKLDKIIEQFANEEKAEAYEWATNRKMPDSDISYEYGVGAGYKLGASLLANDFCRMYDALVIADKVTYGDIPIIKKTLTDINEKLGIK